MMLYVVSLNNEWLFFFNQGQAHARVSTARDEEDVPRSPEEDGRAVCTCGTVVVSGWRSPDRRARGLDLPKDWRRSVRTSWA